MSDRDRKTLLIILLITITLALPILTYPMAPDQGAFATTGSEILKGRVPYTDLWNPKPPAVFYLFSATIRLLGRSPVMVRAIDLIIFPFIGLSLYSIAMRLANRRVAVLALLGFAAFYFTETIWTLTQSDGIALLPMTLAMALAFKANGSNRRSHWWSFLSGVFSAYALWFKYPFILFVLALAVGHSLRRLRSRQALPPPARHSMLLKDALAFALGGLLIGLGGILYLQSIGALSALIESASVSASYASQSYALQEFRSSPIWNYELREHWVGWRPLILLLVAWPALWQLVKPDNTPRGWGVIWLWALAGLAIMLMQAKGFDYHWLPMLPPLTLIAADSFDRLSERLWRLFKGAREQWAIKFGLTRQLWKATFQLAAMLALMAFMLLEIWLPAWPFIAGQQTQAEYFSNFRGGGFAADESLAVVNYLKERIAPGDSLYIFGFRPEIYYLADLTPASRFYINFPIISTWGRPAWRQENVDTLWVTLPPYVLVTRGDFAPFVTGFDADSNMLLQDYTELNNWLIFNYEPETEIGNILIWRRKATTP